MKSPFKFLDSYTKEDREIFFGREKEIEELYRRVFRGKIMLVYGVSGTGKSSLINCGLANKFQDEDWLPVNVRRGKNMLESMYAAIVTASLTPRSQFMPSETQFRKHVKSLYLDHYKPVYFIFDQFEELFIFGSREEKSLFVRVIKNLVDSDLLCRFIFVMREEYMASVTEFEKHIPDFFSNRVRIENMDINNAIQAIRGPCKVFNINVEDGFPEALIETLSPGSPDIELTYLQVFLDKVYRLSVEESGAREGEAKNISFTLEQLKKTGNVSDLLGTFLNEQVSLLEDPDSALAVLKSFVSVKGTKRQMTIDEVKEYSQTLGKRITETDLLEMLQNFVNLRILRDKDQHDRYELRHDSLATKIFEKISGIEKDILEIRQFIEDGYHNFQKRGIVLNAGDLEYIAPYESRLFLSPELSDFILQSKRELEKKKQKRRMIFIASTLFLLCAFAGFTIWALIERNNSRKQEVIANANYYYALSKELALSDPTKALRIADYACKISPSESNYQNLVNIYSGNEFYSRYLPMENYSVNSFKFLKQSGDIAIIEGDKLKIIDPKGIAINISNFNLPEDAGFDISPDEKNILIFNMQDTLRVYDDKWNLISKTFLKDYYILEAEFVTDTNIILTIGSPSTETYKFYLLSLNGNSKELGESYPYAYLVQNNSHDTITYVIQGKKILVRWIPEKNILIYKHIRLNPSEYANYGRFISSGRIALLTSYDSIKICDLEGRILKSWYAADDENRNFYSLYFIREKNLLCARNDKTIKFWDLRGQNITNLRLNGSNVGNYQYNNLSGELLILLNDRIVGYKPVNLNNELVVAPKSMDFRFFTSENCFIEYSRSAYRSSVNVYSLKGDTLHKDKLVFSNDKYCYKLPGNSSVYINYPDSLMTKGKYKLTIYDIYGNPLVQLKDSVEFPYRICMSYNDSLMALFGKRNFTDSPGNFIISPALRFYNTKGELIKDKSVLITNGKLTSDNRHFLYRSGKSVILSDTSGNISKRYSIQKGYIWGYDISKDNKYILIYTDNQTVKLISGDGKLLKVIPTVDNSFQAFFIPGQMIFQIPDKNGVKLFNTDGTMIQEIKSDQVNPVIVSSNRKYIYYIAKEGILKAIMKIPVDSFTLTNNYNDLSFKEKMEYNIITDKDLMKSNDPYSVFQGAKYYQDKIGEKTDVTEIKRTIRTAEKLFHKGLTFDTLRVRIACNLTLLSIERNQYSKSNANQEIDKYYNIIIKTGKPYELKNALDLYGITVSGGDLDSTEFSYGYYDKLVSISKIIMKMSPEDYYTRKRISTLTSNISFGLLDYREFEKSLDAVKLAIEADSTNQFSYTNLPLAYLFNNQVDSALAEYKKWMNKAWTSTSDAKTFREVYLLDIKALEDKGITHPGFGKVKELLKK